VCDLGWARWRVWGRSRLGDRRQQRRRRSIRVFDGGGIDDVHGRGHLVAHKAYQGVELVRADRADDQPQRDGANRHARQPENCAISGPFGLRLCNLLADTDRARLGARPLVQRSRRPRLLRFPTARRGVRLDLEHAPCEPVYCCRITTRCYRNERNALRGKEDCLLIRPQLMTDKRLDLVAIEVLDVEVGRNSDFEVMEQRPLKPVEKRRPDQ